MMEFSEFDLSCFSLDKLSGLLERGVRDSSEMETTGSLVFWRIWGASS